MNRQGCLLPYSSFERAKSKVHFPDFFLLRREENSSSFFLPQPGRERKKRPETPPNLPFAVGGKRKRGGGRKKRGKGKRRDWTDLLTSGKTSKKKDRPYRFFFRYVTE